MPDSPRRELHVDVTYAHVGLVSGFLLMNESSRSAGPVQGRGGRLHNHPELHSTLEWLGAQVSDLSHLLIHHTNDCTQSINISYGDGEAPGAPNHWAGPDDPP